MLCDIQWFKHRRKCLLLLSSLYLSSKVSDLPAQSPLKYASCCSQLGRSYLERTVKIVKSSYFLA